MRIINKIIISEFIYKLRRGSLISEIKYLLN